MNEHLQRLSGRLDRRHVAQATFGIVGVGRVGGAVALELARLGPKRLILLDGDDLEAANLGGHVLASEFVGWNKAVGLAEFLARQFDIEAAAIPHYINEDTTDEQILSDVIEPATVLVLATDDLAIQRRVSLLARTAEVPAIVPGIAENGERCEAFVSLTDSEPCLMCFDGYRPTGSPVRGAAVINTDAYPAIHLTVDLVLAVLNPNSPEAERLLTPQRPRGPVPQLFRAWPPGSDELARPDSGHTEVAWRENCPGCGGSAAGSRPAQQPISQEWSLPSLDELLDEITPQQVVGGSGALLLFLILWAVSPAVTVLMIVCTAFGIWAGYSFRERH